MKLLTSDFHAALVNDNLKEFKVCLEGPADSLYEGGVWKVRVELPDQYPYKSPSIGFETRIFHPNIDEQSGSVCLDVINQTWSPMFTISHIFETFLPQLLNDPNAADPLNGEASTLYLNDRDEYNRRVRSYVDRFANRATVLANFKKEMGIEDEDDEEDANADAGVEQRVTEDRSASRNTQGTLSEYEIDGDLSSIDDDDEEEVDVHADYGVDGQGATAGTRKTQHLHADTSAHTVHAVAAPGAGDNNTNDSDSDNDSLDLDL